MDDYEAADPNVHRALDLFRQLGDRANEAWVLNGLSAMLERQERYPEALAVALDALRMLKAAGHWWTQGNLENGVGWLYAHLGQYDQALTHCQRSLGLHRESGNRGGTADTLDSMGFIYRSLGDFNQAKAYYRQAIDGYREIGAPFGQGNSLNGFGDVLVAEGDHHGAREAYLAAAAILDTLPHPLANEVRGKLRDLDLESPDPEGQARGGHHRSFGIKETGYGEGGVRTRGHAQGAAGREHPSRRVGAAGQGGLRGRDAAAGARRGRAHRGRWPG